MADATDPIKRRSMMFGYGLYFFAAWTFAIKYALPVGWALSRGEGWTTYIFFWDAWWIFHLIAGTGLVVNRNGIRIWALLLSLAEIIIIITKFVLFLPEPNWDFWHANWFVNKAVMLVFFCVLLAWLVRKDVRDFYGKIT